MSAPILLAVAGPRAGERFELREETVLGRSPSCEIALSADETLSRRHAIVRAVEGGFAAGDLGSRNGTFVNGERVGELVRLETGDRLQVGESVFLFDPPVRAAVDERGASPEELHCRPVEEVLPAAGPTAAALQAALALMACPSEAAALRCAAEEALRRADADRALALLPGEEGLLSAAVAGAETLSVPRVLLQAASERREAGRLGCGAAAPLAAGAAGSLGVLYVERDDAPFDDAELALLGAVARLCGESLAAIRAARRAPVDRALVGASRAFRRCLERVRRAAAGERTVALAGEAGSGKALLAEYLHRRSARSLGPLVRLDCRAGVAALEAELRGLPGTSGAPPRLSALDRAEGGTLVIEALDALEPAGAQLLSRMLGERALAAEADTAGAAAGVAPGGAPAPATAVAGKAAAARPAGGAAGVKAAGGPLGIAAPGAGAAAKATGGAAAAGARLVVTATAAPAELAAAGRLDAKLAAQLDVEVIEVPPLRERGADIGLLFDFFAERAARLARARPPRVTPAARELLQSHRWPGNVRELRLCAERLALAHPDLDLSPLELPPDIGRAPGEVAKLADRVARLERDAIAEALRQARGRKARAAALLGISRPTLDKKIDLYRLSVRGER